MRKSEKFECESPRAGALRNQSTPYENNANFSGLSLLEMNTVHVQAVRCAKPRSSNNRHN